MGIREAELLIKEESVKEKDCKIKKLDENLRFECRGYDRIKKRLSWYEYEDRMRHKREVDRKKRKEEMKEVVRIEEEEREKLREELRNKKLK